MFYIRVLGVGYFNQLAGAPHAVGWSKSFFKALKEVFLSFSITNGKEIAKITQNMHKRGLLVLKINT